MLFLDRLTFAMAEQEGWLNPEEAPVTGGSISYKNHNPLNLRASPFSVGERDGFCFFRSDMDGFAAARWDIIQKAKGIAGGKLNANSTLKDLIAVWAPPDDGNDDVAYLQNVLDKTGFVATMPLSSFL